MAVKYSSQIMLVFFAFLLCGCQEVVNIEVPNESPQLVIEGKLTNAKQNNCEVEISETVNYYKKDAKNPVAGASVSISDESGNTYQLRLDDDSVYRNHQINPESGEQYTLHVEYEDQAYEASGTLLPLARLDSLIIKYQPRRGFNEEGFYIYFNGTTPQKKGINYYRFLVYKNDSLFNGRTDYLLFTDEFTHKKINNLELPYAFNASDTVSLAMYSMDKQMFEYFQQLQNLLFNDGGLFSPPPENPVSNLKNLKNPERNPLGYFQVSSVLKKTIIMPDKKPEGFIR